MNTLLLCFRYFINEWKLLRFQMVFGRHDCEMVGESGYQLRNLSNNRCKRSIESVCNPNTCVREAKRVRRSDSTSSHKENNGLSTVLNDMSCRSRAPPLRSIHPMNTINESTAVSSTPVRRLKVPGNLSETTTRLTRSCSVKTSPIIVQRRTLRSSRRRSIQTVPKAVLQVKLERFSVQSYSGTQSEEVVDSCNSSLENESQTELKAVEDPLSSWFSPRRFSSIGKDQAAKLKRLNRRRMEFDLQELSQSFGYDPCCVSSDSLLNQSMVGDPLEKLLRLCGQTEIKSFDEYFEHILVERMVKIGEGVYGEVFQSPKRNVIKIFPVDGDDLVNGEKQMKFSEVYPEVFVSQKLSELAYKYRRNRSVNFAQLKKATVVRGKLPEALASSWRKYENQRGSDNECPDFLPPEQQWMVLESEFAGEPLANMRFNNCREARSVIEQIALSLAAAESALQFEHRDLHWHNVLVRPTRQWKLRYRVGGVSYAVFTEGIQVTIIDFTVSRLCHEGNIVYVDMSESPEIFECEGDYQFDIYRIMRDNNGNDWRPFHPISNLYWLHYLMGKLLNETSYPRRDPDSQPVESELRALYDIILAGDYKSATQLVSSSFYFDSCRIG
ncbi:Serine/threonine-protein kinase haspin [Schistosoma japonicum]|nr:Serine/threonine-protein kinase haspin [Schistosoma japonicum]